LINVRQPVLHGGNSQFKKVFLSLLIKSIFNYWGS